MPSTHRHATATRVEPLLSIALLILSTLVAPSAAAVEEPAPTSTPGLLFVQNAVRATVSPPAKGASVLTLHGIHDRTRWFTDRPARRAGSQATASFVRQWSANGFASVPPNAVIETGGVDSVPVTLRNPRFDRSRNTLTYTITPIGQPASTLPRTMRDVALFIDPSGTVQQQVVISVSNLTPGMQFAVTLGSRDDAVTFTGGSSISSPQGIPILASSVSTNTLSIATGSATSFPTATMQITLTITSDTGPNSFTLQASAAPGVNISAQVGVSAPVMLGGTPTMLAWMP